MRTELINKNIPQEFLEASFKKYVKSFFGDLDFKDIKINELLAKNTIREFEISSELEDFTIAMNIKFKTKI